MHLAYLGAAAGHTEDERARRRKIVRRLIGGAFDISFLYSREGPAAIDTPADERAAVGPIVDLAVRNESGFDGYIITCFGDVGIHELRRAVAIPVIAPARATYTIAAAVYSRFSILSLNDVFVAEEIALVKRLGIRAAVSHIKAVNLKVQQIARDPDEALRRMRAVAATIDDTALVPGCMSMAYLLEGRGIRVLEGLQVVNPLRCGLRLATAMIV